MKPDYRSNCFRILAGLLLATLSVCLQGCGSLLACSRSAPGVLFISSPNSGEVHFSCLLDADQQSRDDKMESKKLTGVESIAEPRGLAMDSVRMILYIVDGNSGAPALYAARLYYSHTGNVAAETPKKIIEGLASNWVTVDFRGTVFFVANNQLLAMSANKVTEKLDSSGNAVSVITAAAAPVTATTDAAGDSDSDSTSSDGDDGDASASSALIQVGHIRNKKLRRVAAVQARSASSSGEDGDGTASTSSTSDGDGTTSTSTSDGDGTTSTSTSDGDGSTSASTAATSSTSATTATVDWNLLYDGQTVTGVACPRGIAADGYHLYWTNGENGNSDGTLVQGFEQPHGSTTVTPLDTSLPFAHGVCLSPSRIFFTDEESKVYSVSKAGGTLLTVTDQLQNPRGCAFDGDGTVFIADQGDSKVVSFAGGAAEMGPRQVSLALSGISEPYGLAVFHKDHQYLNHGQDDLSEASRGTSVLVATIALVLIHSVA